MIPASAKQINDPVHGFITLEPEILQFVDTPHFQRLRELAQLGTTYFVFPGASHKRFEHSLGVCHLSSLMVSNLKTNQPELNITKREEFLVKVAGLCHDLGHGPFSHVFDNEVIPRLGKGIHWSHEDGSLMMLDSLIDDYAIDLEKNDIEIIKQLILPPKCFSSQNSSLLLNGRKFLYDIVANRRNSIDVDKFDYIIRDSRQVGLQETRNHEMLMRLCRVIDDEICYHSKCCYDIYELFHSRYSLHKRVYSHRVSKSVELMVTDALILAEPFLKIGEKLTDPHQFMQLTDSILQKIEFSDDSSLEASKSIIRRIKRRKLYKQAGEIVLPSESQTRKIVITPEDITTFQSTPVLVPDDIIVSHNCLDYAMHEQNPVDLVHFYDSSDMNRKYSIENNQVSHLVPQQYSEQRLRVFCRDPTPEKLHAASVALDSLLQEKYGISSSVPLISRH